MVRMTPRYITARRADGRPTGHLSVRRLRHMRARFERLLMLLGVVGVLAACVAR